jgi:heme O synthase-like polyprenyltransferase
MFGYSVAPGEFVLADFLASGAGTACFAVAASCVNQILERDLDAKMMRTRGRPLPMKTLSVNQAIGEESKKKSFFVFLVYLLAKVCVLVLQLLELLCCRRIQCVSL